MVQNSINYNVNNSICIFNVIFLISYVNGFIYNQPTPEQVVKKLKQLKQLKQLQDTTIVNDIIISKYRKERKHFFNMDIKQYLKQPPEFTRMNLIRYIPCINLSIRFN
jgi:hypothetical protein